MKEKLKYLAQIASVGFFTFIKINLLSFISTSLIIIVGYNLLKNASLIDNETCNGILDCLKHIAAASKAGIAFWILAILAGPILFFSLGNKYILGKVANKVVDDSSEDIINPLLDKVLGSFESQTYKVQTNDSVLVKAKLIGLLQNESSNKWVRRIVSFGIKKAMLDDVDFQASDFSFNETIKLKTNRAIDELTEPNKLILYAILIGQWMLLLAAWLLSK